MFALIRSNVTRDCYYGIFLRPKNIVIENFCWRKTELSLEKKSQAINSQDKIMLASVQLYVFPMTKNPFNVNLRDSPLTLEM